MINPPEKAKSKKGKKDTKKSGDKDPKKKNLNACRKGQREFKGMTQVCECRKPLDIIGGVCDVPDTKMDFCRPGQKGAGKTCKCKSNQKVDNGACVSSKAIAKKKKGEKKKAGGSR